MSSVLTLTHDEMAIRAATQMRDLAVKGEAPWSRVFGSDIVITSSSDWPEPDFVFSDPSSRTMYGFEFKPPGQERREYLTGLGQTLGYLKRFEQALLIVPEEAEGFKIATYLAELADGIPLQIGLVSYDRDDIGNLQLIHAPPTQPVGPLQGKASLSSTFWAFWMDQSINEFYLMLKTAYELKRKQGDIRKEVFTRVFDLMKKGKTYANDGNHRDLKQDLDFSSWFTNYHLPYEHCELWGNDGKLTLKGVRLYLWDIQMKLIDEKIVHNSVSNYLDLMRDRLVALGFGKPPGVRKEITKMMSLWGGGFRILKRFGGSYYLQKFGLVPDWPKVNEIMTRQIW
jgi:hypothetical protein